MAKRKKNRESSNSKNNNQSNQNCKTKKNSSDSKKFSDFSYAELIVLSATLSYSISEELDEDDLAILVAFLALLLAEIEVILAQRAIINRTQVSPTEGVNADVEDIDIEVDLGE